MASNIESVPGLVSEALVQRQNACDRLLEMVSSGGGLAINPSTIGFEYGEHDLPLVYNDHIPLSRFLK